MENKEINSHFIQKAMAKRWATDNKVSYIIHGTKEGGSFNIKNYKKQPIAIEGFYTEEIEKGMNTLEVEGDRVIKKVLLENSEIILTRKEVTAIKFYYILASYRTKLIRSKIKNLDFNKDKPYIMMNKDYKKTSQELQELVIKILLEKYDKYRKDGLIIFSEVIEGEKRINQEIEKMIQKNYSKSKIHNELIKLFPMELNWKMQMNLILDSKLIFVKFNEGELFLTEGNGFTEKPEENSLDIKYAFFPISPNVGILLIPNLFFDKKFVQLSTKSNIFKFDLNEKNKIEYEKEKEIFKFQKNNLKNSNLLNNIDFGMKKYIFDVEDKTKFCTNNDQFIYQVHFETKEVATKCNASALINSKNSYIIYKSIHNYNDALQKNKEINWINKSI